LRADDPAEAFTVASKLSVLAMSHAECAERAVLLGAAATRLGKTSDAVSWLSEALAYSVGLDGYAQKAEVEYYAGLLAFSEGDVAELALRAQAIVDGPTAEAFTDSAVPLAHTRARAYEALTLAAWAEGDYLSAAEQARRALDEMRGAPTIDAWIYSQSMVNLAVCARDFDRPADAVYIAERLNDIEWLPAIASRQFDVLTCLGWADALEGNHVGAFRRFRLADRKAPSGPDRVLASLWRASLAEELGQHIIAEEELSNAIDLSGTVDWERSPSDRRLALLLFAQVAAPTMPEEARKALNRYRNIRSALSVLTSASAEPRIRAEEAFANGRIARADGNAAAALDAYMRAYEIWSSIGLLWRAALAAVELCELGVDGFREPAFAYARRRPHSWLARRTAAL